MTYHHSNDDRPTLAYSATDPDETHYRYFEPAPAQHRSPNSAYDDDPRPDQLERPAMIANPRTFIGGLVVTGITVALGTWLLVWVTNAALSNIPLHSRWSRPLLDIDTAIGAAIAAVVIASALLLGLVATVEPPRTFYTWTATLLALIGLVVIYTATSSPAGSNWRTAIAPLIVAAVIEFAVVIAVAGVGSRTLRTLNERGTIQ